MWWGAVGDDTLTHCNPFFCMMPFEWKRCSSDTPRSSMNAKKKNIRNTHGWLEIICFSFSFSSMDFFYWAEWNVCVVSRWFFVCVSVCRLFCYVETRNGWVILFGCLFSDQRSGVEFSKDRNTNSWTDDGRPTFYTFLFWKQIWSGVLRGTAMIHPSILVTKKLFWVAFSILRNRYCSLFIP